LASFVFYFIFILSLNNHLDPFYRDRFYLGPFLPGPFFPDRFYRDPFYPDPFYRLPNYVTMPAAAAADIHAQRTDGGVGACELLDSLALCTINSLVARWPARPNVYWN